MNSLVSALMVVLVFVLALLFYGFVSGLLSFPESEERATMVALVPPQVLLVGAEKNADNNFTHICLRVRNTTDTNLPLSSLRLYISGEGLEVVLSALYSTDCPQQLPPRRICTVCTDYPLPSGRYTVALVGTGESQAVLKVNEDASSPGWSTDINLVSVSVSNGLYFAPPESDRYAQIVFHGERNAFYVRVTLRNEGNGDAYQVTVSATSSKATFNNCTVSVPAGGTATCTLIGNTTDAGEMNITVYAEYAPDLNTSNNGRNVSTEALLFGLCSSCSECADDLNAIGYAAQAAGVNAVVVLTADVLCNQDVTIKYPLTLDGNGHTLELNDASLVASGSWLNIRNATVDGNCSTASLAGLVYSYGGYSSIRAKYVDFYVRGECYAALSTGKFDLNRVRIYVYADNGLGIDAQGFSLVDANIYAYGQSSVALQIDVVDLTPSSLALRNVVLEVNTDASAVLLQTDDDYGDYYRTTWVDVTNVRCLPFNRPALFIDSTNASEYNRVPIDANAYCFVVVHGVSDMYLAFTGSVRIPSTYLIVDDVSKVEINGLNVTTNGHGGSFVDYSTHAIVFDDVDTAYIRDSVIHTEGSSATGIVFDGNIVLEHVEINAVAGRGMWNETKPSIRLTDVNVITYDDGVHAISARLDVNLVAFPSRICSSDGWAVDVDIVNCPECNAGGVCSCGNTFVTTGIPASTELNCPCCEVNTWANCVG